MQVAPLLKRAMSTKMKKTKKELLSDIVFCENGLSIENVFGDAAWQKFAQLTQDDEIVVVGNGPVSSCHGAYIDNAKMVVRCNHYDENKKCSSPDGGAKIGRKCDVQFVCLHGRMFQKKGCSFCMTGAHIRKWCWRWRTPTRDQPSPKRSKSSNAKAIPSSTKSICLKNAFCRQSLKSIALGASMQ